MVVENCLRFCAPLCPSSIKMSSYFVPYETFFFYKTFIYILMFSAYFMLEYTAFYTQMDGIVGFSSL